MGYFKETYKADLEPILKDWITNISRGQNVQDVPLSLVNRAMKNIWQKKPWCDFATDVSVDLSSGSYTFPADFGRIISIWGDLSGTGVPSYWFYEAESAERGYKLRDSFTKAAGHEWIITFYYPQTSVNMIYQRVLEDLDGTGTEYLAFPANLILLECQKINSREKGNINELNAYSATFDIEFKEFCNAHQWVNYDPTPSFNDRNGVPVSVETYTLDGSINGRYSNRKNSHLGM
jgi:hypothetical protein